MALVEIGAGNEARSSVLNDNFKYLEDQLSLLSSSSQNSVAGLSNTISSISSELNAIQGSLTNVNKSISEVDDKSASKDLSDVTPANSFIEGVLEYVSPDYSAGYSISSGFVAPSAGWCYFRGNQDHTSTVNVGGVGIEVSYDSGDGQSRGSLSLFVDKGTTVTSFSNIGVAKFYPCKGVQ